MKKIIIVVLVLFATAGYADLRKCRDENKKKLLEFFDLTTKDANYCSKPEDCFYIDMDKGFHTNIKEAVGISVCLNHAYFKAFNHCIAGKGIGLSDDFFGFLNPKRPSGYDCVSNKCVPQYGKVQRRWTREMGEMLKKERMNGGGRVDEKCAAAVDAMFQ